MQKAHMSPHLAYVNMEGEPIIVYSIASGTIQRHR